MAKRYKKLWTPVRIGVWTGLKLLTREVHTTEHLQLLKSNLPVLIPTTRRLPREQAPKLQCLGLVWIKIYLKDNLNSKNQLGDHAWNQTPRQADVMATNHGPMRPGYFWSFPQNLAALSIDFVSMVDARMNRPWKIVPKFEKAVEGGQCVAGLEFLEGPKRPLYEFIKVKSKWQ